MCGGKWSLGGGVQFAEMKSASPECKAREGLEGGWQNLLFFKHHLLWQGGRQTEECCIYGWKRRALQVATPGAACLGRSTDSEGEGCENTGGLLSKEGLELGESLRDEAAQDGRGTDPQKGLVSYLPACFLP